MFISFSLSGMQKEKEKELPKLDAISEFFNKVYHLEKNQLHLENLLLEDTLESALSLAQEIEKTELSDDQRDIWWDRTTNQNCIAGTLKSVQKIEDAHKQRVRSVAFSPDGSKIASGSEDASIKIWENSNCLQTINNPKDGVQSVAFSRYGSTIFSHNKATIFALIDFTRKTHTSLYFKGHEPYIKSIAVSPDGKKIASCSSDQKVKVWNSQTGACLRTFVSKFPVHAVSFSPDSNYIISGGSNHLWLWKIQEKNCVGIFKGHNDLVESVLFSDDKHVVSGSWDATIKVWALATNKCQKTLCGHRDAIHSIDLLPKHKIVSGSADKTIRIWDLKTGNCINTFNIHDYAVSSVVCSPTKNMIASGSADRSIGILSFHDKEEFTLSTLLFLDYLLTQKDKGSVQKLPSMQQNFDLYLKLPEAFQKMVADAIDQNALERYQQIKK